MGKASNISDFIIKAKLKHGNKYDYSLVEYLNCDTPVKIICPKHGIFEQKPYLHINKGSGCPRCLGYYRTTEEFIEISNIKHNYKYDYSPTIYIDSETKLNICCPIISHGIFSQRPLDHLSGKGCPVCGGNIRKTTEQFIFESNIKHNFKYDYSLTNYKNNKEKVNIICPEHGMFSQTPSNHLKYGCIECAGTNNYTTEEFIEKANLKHNYRYDYTLVNYTNAKIKIPIICPNESHGMFMQTPHGHLSGKGCPKCKFSRNAIEIKNLLDKENIEYILEYRFSDCRNINPLPFDFYIPSLNTCIEYNGEQHYIPVLIFNGSKGFESQQIRDKIKINYCKDNKIPLLIIKFDENIEEKLFEFGIIKKESV